LILRETTSDVKLTAALIGVASMTAPSLASAQMWTPGYEIVGQSIQVTPTAPSVRSIFDQGGAA